MVERRDKGHRKYERRSKFGFDLILVSPEVVHGFCNRTEHSLNRSYSERQLVNERALDRWFRSKSLSHPPQLRGMQAM